ncbi:MAG: hypothetical protein JJU24_12100 [Natronohydrobacter sp.]|nr:hypothetical protein [Natronohydrobacter sp.]
MTGKVTVGDAEKLRKLLPGTPDHGTYIDAQPTLCLNSEGGDLSEAIEIALYLRETAIRTHIAAKDECLSACAIIFLGGSTVGFEDGLLNYRARSKHVTARLGFHGPSLIVEDGIFHRSIVEDAFRIAVLASARLFSELDQLRITTDFALSFFEVPTEEYLEIDTPERVEALGVDITGLRSLPAQLSDERVIEICHHVNPEMDPTIPKPPFSNWLFTGETQVVDLPEPRGSDEWGGGQRRGYFVSAEGEGWPFWLGCVLDWWPDTGARLIPYLNLTTFGPYGLYFQGSEDSFAEVLGSAETTRTRTRRISPTLVAGLATPLATLADPKSMRDIRGGGNICGADIRSYRVKRVQSYATLRSEPGFDSPVLQQVSRGASVSPSFDRPDTTQILSAECRAACRLSDMPALTVDALAKVNWCRRTSNVVWWRVRSDTGRLGWMSSRFLDDYPNSPL